MDEKKLILNAIKNRQESYLNDHKMLEEDFLDIGVPSKKDAINKLAKAHTRKDSWKIKPCLQWNGADFVRYIDSILKDFGVPRTFGNSRQEYYYINSLHDAFVDLLGSSMNNEVLKNYIQWWCSIRAPRLTGSGFHLKFLLSNSMMKKFASRYSFNETVSEVEEPSVDMDANSIYNLGGVSMLLIKKGLVVSRHTCLQRGMTILEAELEISKSLSCFNSNCFKSVVNVTLHSSPYSKLMRFDFISLLVPLLDKHGLASPVNMKYESYFAN